MLDKISKELDGMSVGKRPFVCMFWHLRLRDRAREKTSRRTNEWFQMFSPTSVVLPGLVCFLKSLR